MERRLLRTPFGAPALDALEEVVATAQATDPLAPVTVVVSSAPAAVSVRRSLARRRQGLANVSTLALPQLAERLAAGPAAAAGRTLSPTWNAAAVRAGLADAPDPLSRASASAAVEEALTLAFARLREASEAELAALEKAGPRARAVVDRFRDHRRRVADLLDAHDLTGLAAATARGDTAARAALGTVVLHLPRRLARSDVALVEALAAAGPVVALVGVTGDDDADRPQQRLLDQLTPVLGPATETVAPTAPAPARVILAPDPEEEAREAVRAVLAHLATGATDLDRVAVVSRVGSPYRLLLHEQLTRAGLPHHVDLPWSVAQSAPGRVLLGLLDLPERGWRRADLARWLRAGPLRWRGRPVPVDWDRAARRAGVVQGLDQWHERLATRREELAARHAEGQLDDEALARRTADLEDLEAFVTELAEVARPGARRSWQAWVQWCEEALDRYLVGNGTDSWSDDDQADLARLRECLAALAGLDAVEAPPEAARFRRVLADELGRRRRRVGRLGQGVLVGDVAEVVGLDLDLLVVVGLAEGWYPPRHRDDPLLPDRELAEVGLGESLATADRADDRRDHLAARVAAPTVVLTAPRADPRAQRELQPARWLLEELGARVGRRVGVAAAADLEGAWLRRPPSFEDAVRTVSVPVDAHERDLAALLAQVRPGTAEVLGHPVARHDAALARGLEAVTDRRDRVFGPWTGAIGERPELAFGAVALASATRFERWARCPFDYYLATVLGVRPLDEPVDAEGITPRDRGSLVHQVLETFVAGALGRAPDQPWDDDDRERLQALVGEVGDEYRARGMTGRDLGWELESSAMRRWLDAVLDRDEAERAARRTTPVAVELAFGDEDGPPPAEVALPDGRRLLFRGMIDRVDRAEDGSLVVIDYKTGSSSGYSTVDKDRLDRGRHLQLPLYADAARRALAPDDPAPAVDAYYWFVEQPGRTAWRGGPIDDAVQDRFEDVVTTIVEGIETGRFPANPGPEGFWGPPNCQYCDYRRVCPNSKVELWEGVRRDPSLGRYVEMAEPEGS